MHMLRKGKMGRDVPQDNLKCTILFVDSLTKERTKREILKCLNAACMCYPAYIPRAAALT